MSFEIFLERQSGIALDVWNKAVIDTDGARLADGEVAIRHKESGQTFSASAEPGDVELFDDRTGKWVHALRFHDGKGVLQAPNDWGDSDARIEPIIFALAQRLGASVVGDAGETYRPGEPEC